MNPAFVKAIAARIERLERNERALDERITELLAKVEALEAKRGPGRPPKTE